MYTITKINLKLDFYFEEVNFEEQSQSTHSPDNNKYLK